MNYLNRTTTQPCSFADITAAHPHTSFPQPLTDADLEPLGFALLYPTQVPNYDAVTQGVREAAPLASGGQWLQQWEIYALEAATAAANQAAAAQALQAAIVQATQARLDEFARTRAYDGILSACTYATSGVPKFAAEGQYCVNARDLTWAALYAIQAQVQAGTRPAPARFQDLEADLPALQWPA
jgi:hypothetical protein